MIRRAHSASQRGIDRCARCLFRAVAMEKRLNAAASGDGNSNGCSLGHFKLHATIEIVCHCMLCLHGPRSAPCGPPPHGAPASCCWHPPKSPHANPTDYSTTHPPSNPPTHPCTGATCLGLRSAFKESVDLAAWHAQERPDIPPGSLLLAACLGRSVYDRSRGDGDEDAPPACIGVEWLRYDHKAFMEQQQQQQQAGRMGPSPAAASSRGTVLMNAREGGEQQAQKGGAAAAAAAPERPASPAAAPAAGQDSWVEDAAARAIRLAEGALERCFGDRDPLWFAKRFADRARTNADTMQRMAGQLAAAAMGRLPPEGDEGSEW